MRWNQPNKLSSAITTRVLQRKCFHFSRHLCSPWHHKSWILNWYRCLSVFIVLCSCRWEPTEWSSCSTSCDPGTKRREISCKQRVSNSLILDVRDDLCRNVPRLATVTTCNDDKPCVRWRVGNWSQVDLCSQTERATKRSLWKKLLLVFQRLFSWTTQTSVVQDGMLF